MSYTKKSKVKLKTGIILALASLLAICITMITVISANQTRTSVLGFWQEATVEQPHSSGNVAPFGDDGDKKDKDASVNSIEPRERINDDRTRGSNDIHTPISDFTNVRYIPRANYFLLNPRHVPSNRVDNSYTGTCTTTAMQMIMGYHSYFSDRRLVPEQFRYNEFGLLHENDTMFYPLFERDPVTDDIDFSLNPGRRTVGCTAIGTHDSFKDELLNQTTFSDGVWPWGQSYRNVARGARSFVNAHASAISKNVTINYGSFSAAGARSIIDAGRPVVLAMSPIFGSDSGEQFHVVVAYGYATLNGVSGFIVHYGWGARLHHAWVPSSWFGWQIEVTVSTTQNFVETNQVISNNYRVLRCNTTQVETVAPLFNVSVSNGNAEITGFAGNFAAPNNFDLNIPEEVAVIRYNAHGKRYFRYYPVTSIRQNAFNGVHNIVSVHIPCGVTYIGTASFRSTRITSINIPASVLRIRGHAFRDITTLTAVTFATGSVLNRIGNDAFRNTAIQQLVLPNSLTEIGTGAFAFHGTNLTSITIPQSINNINHLGLNSTNTANTTVTWQGRFEFRGSEFIRHLPPANNVPTSFTIPGNILGHTITSIAGNAFPNSQLTNLTIPSTVTSINDSAFNTARRLTNISFQGNERYFIFDSVVYRRNFFEFAGYSIETHLSIVHALYTAVSIHVLDSVLVVPQAAFATRPNLLFVSLPESVTRIEGSAFFGIPNAFPSSLYYVEFRGNSNLEYIGAGAFAFATRLQSFTFNSNVATIANNAFQGTTALTSLIFNAIPSGLNAQHFAQSPITNITFGYNVEYIENGSLVNSFFARSFPHLETIRLQRPISANGGETRLAAGMFENTPELVRINTSSLTCAYFYSRSSSWASFSNYFQFGSYQPNVSQYTHSVSLAAGISSTTYTLQLEYGGEVTIILAYGPFVELFFNPDGGMNHILMSTSNRVRTFNTGGLTTLNLQFTNFSGVEFVLHFRVIEHDQQGSAWQRIGNLDSWGEVIVSGYSELRFDVRVYNRVCCCSCCDDSGTLKTLAFEKRIEMSVLETSIELWYMATKDVWGVMFCDEKADYIPAILFTLELHLRFNADVRYGMFLTVSASTHRGTNFNAVFRVRVYGR